LNAVDDTVEDVLECVAVDQEEEVEPERRFVVESHPDE